MKSNIRWATAHTGLFCALLALLWLALSFSAMLSNAALYKNFKNSALFYAQADDFQFHNGERWNAVADNYADAILLDVSWHMGDEGSPFSAAIDTDYYDDEGLGKNAGLYHSVTQGAVPNTDYTRYWHGGAMFVRLLHLVTDVNGIKTIGFVMTLGLAALTMVLLVQKGHFDLAALLLLSLTVVQIWNIRLSLEYQTAFLVTFGMCPLYLLLERRGDKFLTLLSTAGGVLIAFFDFLTTETLTILLPLILVTAVRVKEGRSPPFKKGLVLLFTCGLCWGAAYTGTFLVKWTAASLVTGDNAFTLALSSVAERVGGAMALGGDAPTGFLPAITANLTMIFGGTARVQPVRVAVGLVIFLGLLVSVWYLFRAEKPERDASLLMLILGAVVFFRFLVLNNHSYAHEFFTYRALAAPVLALLTALRLNIALPEKKGGHR